MAIIDKCIHCGVDVCCRASEVPTCDTCSGREAARKAEQERWAALTVEQKLDELKQRVDAMAAREASSPFDGAIG